MRAWPLPSPTSGETLLYLELLAGGCPAGEASWKPCSPPLTTEVLFGRRPLGQEGKLRGTAPIFNITFFFPSALQ